MDSWSFWIFRISFLFYYRGIISYHTLRKQKKGLWKCACVFYSTCGKLVRVVDFYSIYKAGEDGFSRVSALLVFVVPFIFLFINCFFWNFSHIIISSSLFVFLFLLKIKRTYHLHHSVWIPSMKISPCEKYSKIS